MTIHPLNNAVKYCKQFCKRILCFVSRSLENKIHEPKCVIGGYLFHKTLNLAGSNRSETADNFLVSP